MTETPGTRASLLVRLRDPRDASAWNLFVDLYAPLIYGYFRRCGAQDADAADLTQDVLTRVSQGIQRLDYDPERGTFRGWLRTITTNKIRDLYRTRANLIVGGEKIEELLNRLAADDDEPASVAQRTSLLAARAMELLQTEFEPTTWQAFRGLVLDEKPTQQVADELGTTPNAVRIVKSRVLKRMREEAAGLLD